MEEETMENYKRSCHDLEYLTTTSGMEHIESNLDPHICGVEHSSLSFN